MSFAQVLLALALLCALLQFCSVRLRAAYQEELSLTVSYLFLRFRVWPRPQKPKRARKKEEEKRQDEGGESFLQKLLHEKGLPGLLQLLRGLAKAARGALKVLLPHVRAKNLSLDVAVATDDAADTAVAYGLSCSVIYPALSALVGAMRCNRYHVEVRADFQADKPHIQGEADLKIRLVFLIAAALKALLQYMKFAKEATISRETQ